MFSLKLTARPDARMVEVPLEIEAELPREFEGAALLASSGLPRRVRIKSAKDALKLSTAYRADQLVGDIVRSSMRGTTSDVHRVQEAVMKFVRAVRERRQDGATLLVSSNGRGKIDVVEMVGASRPPPPPSPVQPFESTPPRAPTPDVVALLVRRVAELEAAMARLAAGGDLVERIAQLEQKLAPAMAQISRTLGSTETAGPGLENRTTQPGSRSGQAPRRGTAIEAYAEGLRSELRARASDAAARARADADRCDRFAALAVDAELLGASKDGTSQRMRDAAAQVAARQTALTRLADEIEFYGGSDLALAARLLARLEEPAVRDPAPSLEPAAHAVVRAAPSGDGEVRTSWLQRAALLCGWQLVTPAPGDAVQPEWHQAIDSGGDTVVELACPGLKRLDGTLIVEARVKVGPVVESRPPTRPSAQPPPPPPDDEMPEESFDPGPPAAAPAPPLMAAEALATAIAAAPEPAPAVPVQPSIPDALPAAPETPLALLPPHSATPMLAFAALSGETAIGSEEAATAAIAAARTLQIVSGDPAINDEALAAEVALAVTRPPGDEHVQGDLVDARTEEIRALLDPAAHSKGTN